MNERSLLLVYLFKSFRILDLEGYISNNDRSFNDESAERNQYGTTSMNYSQAFPCRSTVVGSYHSDPV